MTRLILVRHGETDWNREGRIQGWLDIELNELGRKQAMSLADELKEEKIESIYSSSLRRALETAKLIAKSHSLEVKEEPNLKEINQGEWQGLTVDETRLRYGKLYERWLTAPLEVRSPGGETIKEAYGRVTSSCRKIVEGHPNGTICIVAHKVASALIKSYYQGIKLEKLWELLPENGTWELLEVKP